MKQTAKIAALGAIGLLLTWGGLTAQQALAHDSHPGLQLSIDIKGLNDCTTRVRDPTCTLPTGSTFTIQVYLDGMGEGVSQYEGFDIKMPYTGVTPNQDGNDDAWPDCGFPGSFYGTDFIALGCAIGVPPAGPSSYIGVIGTNSFKCTQSGSVTLAHGPGTTDLVEALGTDHTEVDTDETINIICGQVPAGQPGVVATATEGGPRNDTPPPRPTAKATAVATKGPTLEPTAAAQATAAAIAAQKTASAAGSPTPGGTIGGTGGGGSSKTWVWIVVGIAGAAAVVVAAGGGWWYMRTKGGGGTPGTPGSGGGTSA